MSAIDNQPILRARAGVFGFGLLPLSELSGAGAGLAADRQSLGAARHQAMQMHGLVDPYLLRSSNDGLAIVVATGRFQQPLHTGHLEYLRLAELRAGHSNALFVVLTGPADDELSKHETLTFAIRRAMIATATGIGESQILNQRGSPHGGLAAVTAWARSFFSPIDALVNRNEISRLELIMVRKPSDVKDYGTGRPCHYSDLLVALCDERPFSIVDVTSSMTHIHLSSSTLRQAGHGSG